MNKFIIVFILLLIAAGGAAGVWYWQGNQYSKETLKLEILGPETAQAGAEIEYLVKLKNNGKARLEEAELVFQYPDRAVPLQGRPQRVIEDIGVIYPGDEKVIGFKARLFSKENESLEAKALVTYRPKNLKAQYERETSFITQIKFVPLTFEFDLPLKVEQGEKIDFSLNYFSNIDYALEDLRVKMEYPEGFAFIDAQPKALDETEWDLPAVYQANGGRVEIEGILDGEEGARKVFKAQLGILKDSQFILLKEASHSVEIIEPSLYISQIINSSQTYIANPDELLHYEVFFKNIGAQPIQKKFLFIKLESEFFDLESLKSEKGEVGRGDNSIIWDWKSIPSLRFLDAGQEGKVEFWVQTKPASEIELKMKNPILKNRITLGGTEKVLEVKINSAVKLSQKIFYQEEVFGNSGPLPPQVGEKTTYTVFWQLTNTWNKLENIKVKTTLPENVFVTGRFFPEEAKFAFDSKSREVLWNVNAINEFQGIEGYLIKDKENNLPVTLAFQIEYIPDSSQRGKTPFLVEEAEVLAEDVFTSDIVQIKAKGVDTTLPDDETVSREQGIID